MFRTPPQTSWMLRHSDGELLASQLEGHQILSHLSFRRTATADLI
jgi:hypothetical protein